MKFSWQKQPNTETKNDAGGHGRDASGLADFWQNLAGRDKFALAILALFLFGFIGVFGGMELHNKASKQQASFDNKVNEFFWLRSQSSNLKADSSGDGQDGQSGDGQQSISVTIANNLRQSGINNPQVTQVGDDVQLRFQHSSQALVNNVINQLQQTGFILARLDITQNNAATNLDVQITLKSSN